MNYNKREKEIAVLVENSLISNEQADNIKKYYKQQSKNVLSLETSMLLPLIGVLLIGAGFIALCASNWENISDLMKLIIAFIPMTVLNAALFKNRESESEVLIQCLTFGVAFAILFAFGIVTNVYQTPIDTNILIHMGLFSVLPLVYVFDAYWLGVVALVGGIGSSDADYMILSVIGLLSLLPYTYNKIKRNLPLNTLVLLNSIALFRLLFLFYDDEVSMLLSLSILLLVKIGFDNELFQRLLKYSYYILGIILCFFDDSINIDFYIPLVLIVSCLVLVLYFTRGQTSEEGFFVMKYNYECSAIMFLTILNICEIPTDFLATLLMLFIAAFTAFIHFKNKSLSGYNMYSFGFTLLVLSKMASLDMPFTAQGILFIILGIISLIISRHIAQIIKEEAEEEVMGNE